MKNPTTTKRMSPAKGISILTLCLLSTSPAVRGEWFVEVGPFYRGDTKISVDGGSRAHDSGSSAPSTVNRGGTAMAPGTLLNDDGSTAVFRAFDNGYVGPSGWVWAQNAGVTQYFAYQTPDQYDAGADTLSFTNTLNGTSATSTRTSTRITDRGAPGWNDSKHTSGTGLIVTLGLPLRERTDAADVEKGEEENDHELSLLFRFGWLEGMGANFRNRPAYQQDVSTSRFSSSVSSTAVNQYTYDTLGNPFFPAAPYTMADPGGVGPLISDTPDSITPLTSANSLTENSTGRSGYQTQSLVDLNLDVQAFTFQFGPRCVWGPKEGVSLFLQPLVTLNLIDASANRQEHFSDSNGKPIGTWNDHADEQIWEWGAGIQLGLQASVSENWYINGSGGYDWVKSTHLNVGPDRILIDLSGYQLELALGRRF
ncbi:MAG: hypothetical protein PF795_06315 [Kiritimatiellae bacterium]|jgi:hypothetical protein|nr:hypothetical protein [Kiritimatiellia bacterium]